LPGDPLSPASARPGIAAPWPIWAGAEERPGTLQITATGASARARHPFAGDPRPFWLEAGPGVVPIPDPEATSGARASYRVERPGDLGSLRWNPEATRVNVSVEGQLTIHPDSADWEATVRFQAAGGPCDALSFKLPTAWAVGAEVEIEGEGHRLASRPDGETTAWTVRPSRPIWGPRRLTIRSSRPIRPGDALAFPDLVPLGWGTAEGFLAIANASGRPIEYEGSPGLQPIDAARLPSGRIEGPPGVPGRAYRVRQEGWSLRLRVPRGAGPVDGDPEAAAVALADLTCTLAADGSARGEAHYDLDPRPGSRTVR
jgi:hypothetical protein